MKKLRLDIDDVQVVSFTPHEEERGGSGTVVARAATLAASCGSCPPYYCPNEPATRTCFC